MSSGVIGQTTDCDSDEYASIIVQVETNQVTLFGVTLKNGLHKKLVKYLKLVVSNFFATKCTKL